MPRSDAPRSDASRSAARDRVRPGASRRVPTDEQQQILDAYREGEPLVIEAAAGTGKTTTLTMLAEEMPGRRGLYVAFNQAIAREARGKFPSWFDCRTAHSLAFAATPRELTAKLSGKRLTDGQVATALGFGSQDFVSGSGRRFRLTPAKTAKLAKITVDAFTGDVEPDVSEHHVPSLDRLVEGDTEAAEWARETLLAAARKLWAARTDPASQIPLGHDDYLKLWSLSNPEIDADVILFDEAQDADPVVYSVVSRQQAQIVAVGDAAQSIYGWRGAVAALDGFGGTRLPLTQSFRFGPDIAEEANVWLDQLAAKIRVRGLPGIDSVVGPVRGPDAILCRTNAGVIGQVIEMLSRNVAVTVTGERKVAELKNDVLAAEHLRVKGWTSHAGLWVYSSWTHLLEEIAEAESRGDVHEYGLLVSLLSKFSAAKVVAAIDSCVPADDARVAISTVHVAKGLEWGRVRIHSDFREPKRDKRTGLRDPLEPEEARLAYVAVTRARHHLDPAGVEWVHTLPNALAGPQHLS